MTTTRTRPQPVTTRNVISYLDTQANRASAGKAPLTAGTWAKYHIKGEAWNYGQAYVRRMLAQLAALEAAGEVRTVRSAHGATAYIRAGQ